MSDQNMTSEVEPSNWHQRGSTDNISEILAKRKSNNPIINIPKIKSPRMQTTLSKVLPNVQLHRVFATSSDLPAISSTRAATPMLTESNASLGEEDRAPASMNMQIDVHPAPPVVGAVSADNPLGRKVRPSRVKNKIVNEIDVVVDVSAEQEEADHCARSRVATREADDAAVLVSKFTLLETRLGPFFKWKNINAWESGTEVIPSIHPDEMFKYVGSLMEQAGYAYSSTVQFLKALVYWVKQYPAILIGAGKNDEERLSDLKVEIRFALKYWRNKLGVNMPFKSIPMALEVFFPLMDSLNLDNASDLRDAALFAVAYCTGARGKDLVNIRWAEIEMCMRGGLEGLILQIRQFKQADETHPCRFDKITDEQFAKYCPYALLKRCGEKMGAIDEDGKIIEKNKNKLVFPFVRGEVWIDEPMNENDITPIFKKRLEYAGLPFEHYCCKSFRSGLVTTVLTNEGEEDDALMGVFYNDSILQYLAMIGRWKNTLVIMKSYVGHPVDLNRNNTRLLLGSVSAFSASSAIPVLPMPAVANPASKAVVNGLVDVVQGPKDSSIPTMVQLVESVDRCDGTKTLERLVEKMMGPDFLAAQKKKEELRHERRVGSTTIVDADERWKAAHTLTKEETDVEETINVVREGIVDDRYKELSECYLNMLPAMIKQWGKTHCLNLSHQSTLVHAEKSRRAFSIYYIREQPVEYLEIAEKEVDYLLHLPKNRFEAMVNAIVALELSTDYDRLEKLVAQRTSWTQSKEEKEVRIRVAKVKGDAGDKLIEERGMDLSDAYGDLFEPTYLLWAKIHLAPMYTSYIERVEKAREWREDNEKKGDTKDRKLYDFTRRTSIAKAALQRLFLIEFMEEMPCW